MTHVARRDLYKPRRTFFEHISKGRFWAEGRLQIIYAPITTDLTGNRFHRTTVAPWSHQKCVQVLKMIGMVMLSLQLLLLLAATLWRYADCSDEMLILPAISGLRGSTVELPCDVKRSVLAVFWYRHNSTKDPTATIVIQKFGNKVINNVGPRFIMTSTYSLVIRNLSVEDETTYSCHVALANGDSPRLYINLTVIVLAEPLHPTVDHCNPTSDGECTYTVGKLMEEFELFPIVCRVSMVRPQVNLSWTSVKGDTHSEEYARRNTLVKGGFWNVSLGLKVSRHEVGGKFRCLAEGVGVKGTTQMVALVERYEPGTEEPGVTAATPSDSSVVGGFIAVIVVLTVVIGILTFLLLVMIRKFKAMSSNHSYSELSASDLQVSEMRNELATYKPGAYARVVQEILPKKTLLAVYGVEGGGRSSLAKSLIYSVTDEYLRIETGLSKDGQGVTKESSFCRINDNIAIQDNVGLPKGENEVSKLIDKMLTDGICCPIIVIDRNQDIEPYEPLFKQFITDVTERLSFPPVFVVTSKNYNEGSPDNDKMIELITNLGGSSDKIFFVDNILEETSDELSKKDFLGLLIKYLEVADDNIVHRANKISEVA